MFVTMLLVTFVARFVMSMFGLSMMFVIFLDFPEVRFFL